LKNLLNISRLFAFFSSQTIDLLAATNNSTATTYADVLVSAALNVPKLDLSSLFLLLSRSLSQAATDNHTKTSCKLDG
jgi:hypothetical protein